MKLNVSVLKQETFIHGLTQRGLSKNTGLSIATLSKIYNGGSCSVQTALKIAKALEIDLSQLVKE